MVPAGSPRPGKILPLRSVVFGALVPSLLFGIGIGIVLPLIPISATRLGGDLAVAGLVAALLPLGKIAADVPAGMLAARIGDRSAMILAATVGLAAFAGAAVAVNLWFLALSVLILGSATAVFHLARHAFLTEITPQHNRARVLSTLGGMHRLGYFIGPGIGAALIATVSIGAAYWLAAGCALLVVVVLVIVKQPKSREVSTTAATKHARMLPLMYEYRHLFMRLGAATLLVGAVRGARQTVLPLWGEFNNFDPEVISLIFSLSGALDMLLFYPAGKIMDRFGRLWIAVPSTLIMGIALALLPLTSTVGEVATIAILLGFGNGIGSGIIMTLGADVAPPAARSRFLGVWRIFQDTGDAAGPLAISAGAALGSLAAGIWVTAVLGVAAAGALGRWVPRYSIHANRTTRHRADTT